MKLVKWGMIAVGALAAGALLGTALLSSGGTASAEGPSANGPASAFEQALAQKLGISVEQLQADQQAAFGQSIDQAVASGRIAPDEAAKLKSLKPGEAREALRKRLGGQFKHAVENVIDSAAKTLGLTKDQVKTSLQSGQSLAQIAASRNMTTDQLKAGMTANIQAQLQAAVASGKLTPQQSSDLLAGFSKHLDKIIQRTGGQHKKPTTTTTTTAPTTQS